MIEPVTAAPARNPDTAADRSGYRSPPSAMIIGNTGPVANPVSANSAIDTGSDGTRTAPTSATPVATAVAIAKSVWSKRSENRAATSRPNARPPQNRERAVVATPSGAGSRNLTSQLDTPISPAT